MAGLGRAIAGSRGHRPFFLAASAYAALALALWLAVLDGRLGLSGSLPAARWHAHEMIFGYLVAVLSGFLLTTTRGARVFVLLLLWAAGRLAILLHAGAPSPVAAVIDVAYLPALALLRDPPLWRRPKWPTTAFLPLLLGFAAINAAFHLDALGVLPGASERAVMLAVDAIALMIAIIGGRLVPGYTRAMLIPVRAPRRAALEAGSVALLLLMALADAAGMTAAGAGAALAAGALQAARLAGWRTRDTLSRPLLLVLHVGFAWLALGLVLNGLAGLAGVIAPVDALHAITVGAVGTLTLGMMARLIRSHARLPLTSDAPTTAAFALVIAAALLRSVGPVLAPEARPALYLAAGAAWIGAYALFLLRHALLPRSPSQAQSAGRGKRAARASASSGERS
jgi:uncharacterized protein involved in response to NO